MTYCTFGCERKGQGFLIEDFEDVFRIPTNRAKPEHVAGRIAELLAG